MHNYNAYVVQVRMNPLISVINRILVGRNFWNSYTIIAYIFSNYYKDKHIYYKINKQLNIAKLFMEVILAVVDDKFLTYYEILVMDNAAIYVGG